MGWFRRMPMAAVAVVVGTVIAVAWIAWDGTLPLVISIVGGGVIALRAVLGDEDQSS